MSVANTSYREVPEDGYENQNDRHNSLLRPLLDAYVRHEDDLADVEGRHAEWEK